MELAMLLRRMTVQNARSFLNRAELILDGNMSIIIGPNGGGKTNLLDILVIAIRRHLQSPYYFIQQPTPINPDLHTVSHNDTSHMALEKHSAGAALPQIIELDIELTTTDIENMASILSNLRTLKNALSTYQNYSLDFIANWNIESLIPGAIATFVIENGLVTKQNDAWCTAFFDYIHNFELISFLHTRLSMPPLTSPILYLPINRSQAGVQSSVSLGGFNETEQRRQAASTYSRAPVSLMSLALGKLALKRRNLEVAGTADIDEVLRKAPELQELSRLLETIGYDWDIACTNPSNNQYDLRLSKQGIYFNLSAASSGERELINYIFSIYVLNIRNALIIIDEPELHLHPRWQNILLDIFTELMNQTGNQFLLATHAPAFVSPHSIHYISRVFSQAQNSHIKRLSSVDLPNIRHLFNIINSQNNEKIFFADKVILVEGITDRIFFEALAKREQTFTGKVIEIIQIGGKGFFDSYTKTLNACEIEYAQIADLDYVEQVGPPELRSLFRLNSGEIKKDVIDNVGSMDGAALVERIDEAMISANWSDARATWEYIKSRRKQLSPNLSESQQKTLAEFIESCRSRNLFILSKGALEKYLPEGYRKKDVEKIIMLVNEADFLEKIDDDSKKELELIIRSAFR